MEDASSKFSPVTLITRPMEPDDFHRSSKASRQINETFGWYNTAKNAIDMDVPDTSTAVGLIHYVKRMWRLIDRSNSRFSARGSQATHV